MKQIIKPIIALFISVINMPATAQSMEEAIAFSHAGKYAEAEQLFTKLINKDGANTQLLIASGFNNAWNKNYAAAESRFNKALQVDPSNADAAKGLAYTYLYKGHFAKAASAFNKILIKDQYSEESRFALGLAYMNLQKKNKAKEQFEKVLQINKSNTEAGSFIKEIEAGRGIVELSALAGISSADGESKFGLRQIQAGYHINNEVQVYARYDNSLSQDNYFFIKNNFNSHAFMGGLYARWHNRIGSKIEYGYRSLPGKIDQNIYQTEQVIFLPKNFAVKLGGSIITVPNLQNEWMLMSSVSVPIAKKFKIEPHYYFIRRIDDEHRFLLNIGYNISPKTDAAVGIFNGTEKNIKTNIKYNVFGMYAYSNIHIRGPWGVTVLARYEKDAAGRNSFIAATGLKVRFGTK
ncbi:MAG: tetratricopeptide repeat protein [Chitinophagaceae bacterium]|nr:tetratricopeptide repeat protein [Chitinophagaceae bacterium]